MESQIATGADAQLIMKLYDLRREPVMRQARKWVMFEFNPKTAAEFIEVRQAFGTEPNAWLRQVTSYWEMAASFVLHGAVSAEMFVATNPEIFFIYAKFHGVAEGFRDSMGKPFMHNTAMLIEKSAIAREILQKMIKSMEARHAQNS